MTRSEEFAAKLERMERWLSKQGLDGVILSRSDSFAWAGCGASNVVNSASETGVGSLAVEPGRVTLIANNIEIERLLTEELTGLQVTATEAFPWHEPARRTAAIERVCRGRNFVADDGSAGMPAAPRDFVRLRYVLTDAEIERYREAGVRASLVMEAAGLSLQRGMTEAQVAGLLAMGCLQMGIEPVVLLVAADERIRNWRHPVVKDTPAQECVMMVICGRRRGLFAALTRLVYFGELPDDLRSRHRAACAVDAAMMKATTPGKSVSQVFAEAQSAYSRSGYPDEWQFHHQGGAVGYQPREYIATPQCEETVWANQTFAWNPSIRGTKSEDTMLVREQGFELLTAPSPAWPAVVIEEGGEAIPRADILVR